MKGTLGYEQLQTLDREAPERLPVPSGSHIRLDYGAGGSAERAARRCWPRVSRSSSACDETPTVAGGRVQVMMHLLAPNMRPQQVTQDLESFWQNTYPEVRKELAGRYPKHDWPEEPTTAVATKAPGTAGTAQVTATIPPMKIHVVAFATASDVLGRGPTEVELPDGARLSELRALLFERHSAAGRAVAASGGGGGRRAGERRSRAEAGRRGGAAAARLWRVAA